MCCCHNFYICE